MELINEVYVKRLINEGKLMPKGEFKVEENQLFTPSAIEYLNDKNIRIIRGATPAKKPEHMTSLKGDTLVFKNHPVIKYRGALDYLESEIILAQTVAEKHGYADITKELEEIISFVRKLIRVEITGEKLDGFTLIGLNSDELRDHSHHSTKHYGVSHFLPTYKDGEMAAHLNHLRTITRKTELVAYNAFKESDGNVTRNDIIQGLNRLSSVFWIMLCKLKKRIN